MFSHFILIVLEPENGLYMYMCYNLHINYSVLNLNVLQP